LTPHLTSVVDLHVVVGEPGPLVDRLKDLGAAVEVLPMSDRSRNLRRGDLAKRRLPLLPMLDAVRYSARMRRHLRDLQPDVVHTNTLKAAFYGGLAARSCGIPLVWHIRDRIATDYLPRPSVWLTRALARIVPTAIVTDTAAVLGTLHLGHRSGIGRIIPSPIEVPAKPQTAPGGPLRVAMVGRIAPWKGQDLFLRAMADAFPLGNQRAVLIGAPLFGAEDEAFEVMVRRLAHELGIEERVEWRGFRSDMAAELARVHVLVHASVIPEPYGQVILEGMAYGLPVVAAKAGGPAEILTDDKDALLTRLGDVASLAAALRRLDSDPALRQRLGGTGRHTAEAYTAERVVPLLLDLYRSLNAT
jgi:glycosyltransferase involved in cell wall biosynthesis